MEAIYFGNRHKNNISTMINVFWGTEFIMPMLEILDQFQVKTTFFIVGLWAQDNKELLQEIYKRGHELGNHGFNHLDQDTISYEENIQEITMCHNLVKELTGFEMAIFAPPSGAFNETTLKAAQDLGYQTVKWTMWKDTIDWRDKDEEICFKRATDNVLGGDLILMHPTKHTLNALPKILEYYKSLNLTVTSVSNTIK